MSAIAAINIGVNGSTVFSKTVAIEALLHSLSNGDNMKTTPLQVSSICQSRISKRSILMAKAEVL